MPGSQTNLKIDIHCGNQANPMNMNTSNASNQLSNHHDASAVCMQPCFEGFNELGGTKLSFGGVSFGQEQM